MRTANKYEVPGLIYFWSRVVQPSGVYRTSDCARSRRAAYYRKVIENQKTRAQNFDDETDMIDAFVACGGRMDKTGHVKR